MVCIKENRVSILDISNKGLSSVIIDVLLVLSPETIEFIRQQDPVHLFSFFITVGGGCEVKSLFHFDSIHSKNLEYVASGTFCRTKKALTLAEM